MLSLEDYIKSTERVFNDISLEELYTLMPSNPKWMDGAKNGEKILKKELVKKYNNFLLIT